MFPLKKLPIVTEFDEILGSKFGKIQQQPFARLFTLIILKIRN